MAEFKCISCGAIKESEKPCSCPVCGYKMFETPYERAEIFRKEIKDFIAHLKLSEIPDQSFDIYRKVPKKRIRSLRSLMLSRKQTMTAVSLTLQRSRDMSVRQRKPRCSMSG